MKRKKRRKVRKKVKRRRRVKRKKRVMRKKRVKRKKRRRKKAKRMVSFLSTKVKLHVKRYNILSALRMKFQNPMQQTFFF